MPILFGLPTPDAGVAADAGRLVLGGCDVDQPDKWACTGPDRHTWADADEKAWLTAIDAVLEPVPDRRPT